MPLPLIPLGLGLASLIAGGYGVKKGIDAKDNFDLAKSIGDKAKLKHSKEVEKLDKEKDKTNKSFMKLGEKKVDIFTHQIKLLIDEIKKKKTAKSSLKGFEQAIKKINLPAMEKMVLGSLEIEKGLASGTVSGALMGLGAYGSVGMLASASTGTAIAGLSGAAATNATLAWLGGGALSAGGLGMAGGTAVLGGLVAGPAIAITGFVMASKSEEALTKARAYESEVDQAVEKIKTMQMVLKGLQANAKEMQLTLNKLCDTFNTSYEALLQNDDDAAFTRFLAVGRALKNVLDTPILENDGRAVDDLSEKISIATSGILDYE